MPSLRFVRCGLILCAGLLALLGDSPGANRRGRVVAAPSALAAEAAPAKAVRFDGLYRAPEDDDDSGHERYWYYLRFYGDGTVLAVSSFGTPQEVIRTLNKERAAVSRGRYTVERDQIKFSAENKEGVVDYEGTIQSNGLKLRSHSHINEHKSEDLYQFEKVEEPAPAPRSRK
jgi:hypothetical protein